VTRNTGEGFGLFRPKQFKNYLAIAAGSLQEVKDELRDGLDCGYLTAGEQLRLLRLTLRALKANRRLQAYLACKSHENWTETPPRPPSEL
jgi:four helix bundle protein